MSLLGSWAQRGRQVGAGVAWAFQKDRAHRWRAAGTDFEVKSPSRRQLEIMRKHVLTDRYIQELRGYLRALQVQPGQTVLDIGANIGYMSLAYAAALQGSEIVAFEPSATNCEYFAFNTRSHPQILLQRTGLHDREMSGALRMPSASQNARASSSAYRNTGLFSMYGEGEVVSAEIPLVRLDDWLRTYSKRDQVGFVKIDVEGNEGHVLRGAEELLSRVGPPLEVELNPEILGMTGTSFQEVRDHLGRFGYSPKRFENGALVSDLGPLTGNVNMVFIRERVN